MLDLLIVDAIRPHGYSNDTNIENMYISKLRTGIVLWQVTPSWIHHILLILYTWIWCCSGIICSFKVSNIMYRHQNNWRFTMTWEAGWRYGIISTVPNEQQKIYRQIILFQRIYYLSISLGLPCHREPSIVLMSIHCDCSLFHLNEMLLRHQ